MLLMEEIELVEQLHKKVITLEEAEELEKMLNEQVKEHGARGSHEKALLEALLQLYTLHVMSVLSLK
jgi:hypothetical protein